MRVAFLAVCQAALLATLLSSGAGAITAAFGASPAEIDAYVRATMESFGIPGCAVATFDADGLRYSGAFGVADADGTPVAEQTPFVVALLIWIVPHLWSIHLSTMFFIQPDLAYLMGGVATLSGVMVILRFSALLVAQLRPR